MMNAGFPPPQGMPPGQGPGPQVQMAQSMPAPIPQMPMPQQPMTNLGLSGGPKGFNLQDFLKNPEVQKMLSGMVGGQQQPQQQAPQMPQMMQAPGIGQWQPPQMQIPGVR
jgi:hypothetical protein